MSDCIIETKGLTKRYGEQVSVSSLDLHVQKGRIYGLLGRNGAGKTTTMKMLLGLTVPTSGTVTIFGRPLKGNEKRVLPRIGSLIESPGFYPNLTGTENLQIFARLRGLKSPNYIKGALELVNLPYRDKKRYAQYSLGMKQRLAIALAVMHDPELLILDEPINGLDPIGIAEVRDFIRALCDERGKTILLSSHILSEIALLADDIGIIDHGVLLEEESLAELERKNGKVLRFTVSNAPVAAQLLQQELGIQAVTVENERGLTVRDLRLDTGAAVRRFVEAGLVVSDAHLYEDTLEDYFKRITGGELLKLLWCEFAKLRRKPLFFAAAAVSALIPLGCALFLPDFQEFTSGAEAVDGMMSTLFQMSAYLLLMPALVVLASNLLFEEQDNDTLKNLMTVPVSKPALAMAKMALLFLFSIAFMAVGGLVILFIVLAAGWEPVGFWRLFFVGIGQGIMMWDGALPCILLVVLLNRSYIISVIVTFFYTAVNYIFGLNDLFITQPFGLNLGTLLPGPLTFRWYFQCLDFSNAGAEMLGLLERVSPYFVTTAQAFLVTGAEAAVFLALIALVYKRQGV